MAEPAEEGKAAPPAAAGGITAAVERATNQTRSAAKWLIAAFAAIGGTLVAGSQLSEIGELSAGSGRWWAAVGGLCGALLGVLAAALGNLWILLPSRSTLSDAARDTSFARWMDTQPELLPPGETSVERFRVTYLGRQREYDLAHASYERAKASGKPSPEVTARWRRANADWQEVKPWGRIVNDAAMDRKFRRRVGWAFGFIFAGGTVAAVGIAAFAWAAHPKEAAKSDSASAEAPASPVRVRLVLTPAGEELVRKAAGCDPATAEAVRIGGDAATPDVLLLPRAGCKTVRLTLSDGAGEAVEGL